MAAAAHQMRMRRLAARADISAGMMVSRKCSNGSLSRKKNDSFVVIASTTSTMSGSASGAASLATRPVRLNSPCLARDRQQPALDEVVLLGRQHEAGARLQKLAQIFVVVRRHDRAPRNSRDTLGAICSSGSTAEHTPAATARARHAPDHAGGFVLRDDAAAGLDDVGGAGRCRRCPCRSGSAPDSRSPRLRPRTQTADRPRACSSAPARRHRARSRRCRRGARPSCAGRRARDRCARPAPARRRPPRAPAWRRRGSDARRGWW